MKTWMKVLAVTLLTGLPTIPLGRVIWPDPAPMAGMDMGSAPTGIQLPLLIIMSIFEGLAFGLGISFLLFGSPVVRRATAGNKPLTWATFAGITWLLVSWWPHDNLHRVTSDLANLIVIEYTFHVTLIVAACCVALTFLRLLSRVGSPATAALPAGVDRHVQSSASI